MEQLRVRIERRFFYNSHFITRMYESVVSNLRDQ